MPTVKIEMTVAELKGLIVDNWVQPALTKFEALFNTRMNAMNQLVVDLLAKVEAQTTVSAGLRIAVEGLIPITTSAVTTLAQLKSALDAMIAGGTLSDEDKAALQSALDKASADSAADEAAVASLTTAAQALADAVAVNAP